MLIDDNNGAIVDDSRETIRQLELWMISARVAIIISVLSAEYYDCLLPIPAIVKDGVLRVPDGVPLGVVHFNVDFVFAVAEVFQQGFFVNLDDVFCPMPVHQPCNTAA